VSIIDAQDLLRAASAEPNRLHRHLLVAAAFRSALAIEPVVVGGTAEECRVLQATADSGESSRFQSALAIAVACYEVMDWSYVAARLRDKTRNSFVGDSARKIDSKVRRRARLQLSS